MEAVMRLSVLVLGLLFSAPSAVAEVALSPERQSFLEGEWHGVTVDTNANKLCTKEAPPATVLSFEFLRSGGVAFFDNGNQKESGRRAISSASDADGLIDIQLDGQMAAFTFRKDGPDRMALVRNSASLGMPVDVMVFKRCRAAADRSNIALSAELLKTYAVEWPSDTPYFVDTRIAAKVPNACAAPQVQYLFFGLLGPSEFRISRWNSFDLSDSLEAKKKPGFPIDSVGDWIVQGAVEKDGVAVLTARDRENEQAQPITLTLKSKGDGRIAIPEWNREYVRCKGFDKRS
jgi:hypothetical protein